MSAIGNRGLGKLRCACILGAGEEDWGLQWGAVGRGQDGFADTLQPLPGDSYVYDPYSMV